MRFKILLTTGVLFLSATLLPAQRGGAGMGGAHVGGGMGGTHVGGGGRPSAGGSGFHANLRHGGFGHRGHGNGYGYGYGYGAWYPGYLPYDDYWDFPSWDAPEYGPDGGPAASYDRPPEPASAPVVVMQSSARVPPTPAASPKVIEIPQTGSPQAAKSQPALFVLQNGQQIESDRYILSDKSLTVDVGREQRIIPLSDIKVDETIAANHARGLELSIPRDSNSLFLGF